MANYETLKAAIQQVIKTNGNNEIKGALLQQSLLAMINSLGAGFQYAGIATPSTNPGTPDHNVFYFASSPGTYVNFNGIVLSDGETAVLKYNGDWSKETTGFASSDNVAGISVELLSLALTNGKYIDSGGHISTSAYFAYSENFTLKRGESVVVEGSGYSTNVAMLSLAKNNTYTPIIISQDSNVHVWKYTNMGEDAQFAVSFNTGQQHSCKKVVDNQLVAVEQYIKDLFENVDMRFDAITDGTDNIVKLQNGTFTIWNVQVSTNKIGKISVSGTANGSGGRTTKLCVPFSLNAGTYRFVISGSTRSRVFLEKVSGDTIIAGDTSQNFTLTESTNVYVGVNVVNGLTYSDEIGIAIYADTNILDFIPTITAKDLVARKQIIDVDKKNITTKTQVLELSQTTGRYIEYTGNVATATDFAISENFLLKSGETIIIEAVGYSTNVAMLSLVNGNTYVPLIVSADNQLHTWSYTNNGIDAYFALSYNYTRPHTFTKVVNEQISALENSPILLSGIQNIISGIPVVGIIGDSLSSGVTYDENNVQHQNYNFAWWQVLQRESGMDYKYFCEGGLTTRSWFNVSVGAQKAMLDGNQCCVYVIALGVNDAWSLGQSYIGTAQDIKEDYNENADTFFGNYGKIIQMLTQRVPKAKFFAVTVPRRVTVQLAFNDAIREISGIFDNCYLVDLEADYYDVFQNAFIQSQTFGGAHHSAMAYQFIGKIMEKAIGDTIMKNSVDFRYIQFALS